MTRMQTPDALRHDARVLARNARALLEATSDLTDKKVAEARERLNEALEAGKQTFDRLQDRAVEGAKAVDTTVRNNPYQSMAVAFAIGALVGFWITRRD